ncbi:hypothetical protein N658DRAFT_515568 [Parathielavia hyrcaniae]|uniref:Mitochondrial escape protein 2 n=1 Tax=Parathielavia hyrcaniae TaxID=113614 RepID=A0AAN6T2M0_9PEZI|nr:hypothetical protein N658DRAFT_515568 [Parathielavia hyrcaniae]
MILGRAKFWPAARYGPRLSSLTPATFVALGHHVPATATTIGQTRRPLQRWESTSTSAGSMGSDKSGHIKAEPNEAILFVDNLFPLKLSSVLLWRPWDTTELLRRFDSASMGFLDPISVVKRALPESTQIKVTEILPRLKEGGAYVKFTYPATMPVAQIEDELVKSLDKIPIKPWFNPFRGIKMRLVLGRPWLEDLYRLPKSRLRVEFVPAKDSEPPAELSQESLYSLFRRYGKIGDITSQPPDSKIIPKFAYVDFVLVRDAIMARSCMHGFVLQEEGTKSATRLRLSFEQRVKPHHIWNWITSHPRIVIPIVAAFLAAFTVAVFDPIREFFVKIHVQKSLEFTNSKLYKWLKRQTSDMLAFRKHKNDYNALFSHRKDLIDSIHNSLLESVNTFIVVHGPRGSGGRELVMDRVLQERPSVLVLDCKPVVEGRGEAGTIKKLANQVGYRPVFSWTNNMSSMLDLAIQGTTGVKAGFSENLESQIVKILQTTASALKQVSLDGRKKDDKDAKLTDDAYLEAHPERRPVVVIDNFLHKGDEKAMIYEKISDWAAALVQSNIAHVIFLTTDTSFNKPLSKALPDRVFHQVTLGDLSPSVAKSFVISQLEPDKKESDEANDGKQPAVSEKQRRQYVEELDECIDALGGRLTDLQVLARRLKVGQSPKKAVSDIVDQSAAEILRMFLLGGNYGNNKGAATGEGGGDKGWSTEQAWFLIKELAARESLRYNEVLLSSTFASSTTPGAGSAEAAIESLVNAELVTVKSVHGRPVTIRAGKPVYQAAFASLVDDAVVRARMDLRVLAELAKVEVRNIDKAEAELGVLAGLPAQPYQVAERVNYLLAKLQASQQKIVAYEKEMGGLKKVLAEEA